MTSPILTSTYNYENASKRWKDSTTGRFVANSAVVDEMHRLKEATHSTLEQLTRQLYSNGSDRITLAQWQIAVASELKDAHLALGIFGAGGRKNMGFAEFGRVGQTLREQYAFLNNFAQQIANGEVSQAQALARIVQYGNSTQQSYYAEYASQNRGKKFRYVLHPAEHCDPCIARAAGSPYDYDNLQGYPGDGSTPCRGNDVCTLEVVD